MRHNPKVKIQYYVVFTDSKSSHWLFLLLQAPFQHCLVVRDDIDYWTVINPLCSHIDAQVYSKDLTIESLFPNSVQLSYNARLEADEMTWGLGIGSCVDIVKRILGIRAFWIWTPYQLYKRLNHG